MKRLYLFFFAIGFIPASGQVDVSALRVPSPASFERDVRVRLVARPELAALLSGLVIEDAGAVAGDHYFDQSLKEEGEEDTYGFHARSQDPLHSASLFVRIHFYRPSDKTSSVRIAVTVSDAEPRDLKFIETAKPKTPNQPSQPTPTSRRG